MWFLHIQCMNIKKTNDYVGATVITKKMLCVVQSFQLKLYCHKQYLHALSTTHLFSAGWRLWCTEVGRCQGSPDWFSFCRKGKKKTWNTMSWVFADHDGEFGFLYWFNHCDHTQFCHSLALYWRSSTLAMYGMRSPAYCDANDFCVSVNFIIDSH